MLYLAVGTGLPAPSRTIVEFLLALHSFGCPIALLPTGYLPVANTVRQGPDGIVLSL